MRKGETYDLKVVLALETDRAYERAIGSVSGCPNCNRHPTINAIAFMDSNNNYSRRVLTLLRMQELVKLK